MENLLGDERPDTIEQTCRLGKEPLVGFGERAGRGDFCVAVAVDEAQNALRQIAEIVRQVAVQPADHGAMREIPSLPNGSSRSMK